MNEPRRAACTIISPNYLAFARTVASSYKAHHPDQEFYVLLVTASTDMSRFAGESFVPVGVAQIGLSNLAAEAMKYDILELNTNVKPSFMTYLLNTYGIDQLVYLDPDICVYAPLDPVFTALSSSHAVLTPHVTSPINDDKQPSEQDMLYNGTYNLGFMAISNSPVGRSILSWWEQRCLVAGFSEGRTGLFVDQKWMNLAPGMFEGVSILRHPGCNMAYWNLHERVLSQSMGIFLANGEPLCFFHFSGFVAGDSDTISQNTNRYTLTSRPDLQEMFSGYRALVSAHKNESLEAIPYGFDTFSDGTVVTRLARRIYAANLHSFGAADPFDAAGPWFTFCRAEHLVGGKKAVKPATWREFKDADSRVLWVHRLLRIALRVLGPIRYELLMRYTSHIAVLRNQGVFLRPGSPSNTEKR